MPIKDAIKFSRKTFFNPRAWLGYDALKTQTDNIKTIVTRSTTIDKPQRSETFEEATKRLNLSEQDLKESATAYFNYACFFLALAVADFIYGIYLLFHHGAFLGLVLSLAVCALLLAQVFRSHFWYFQIKERRLGCSVQEWRDYVLGKFSKK